MMLRGFLAISFALCVLPTAVGQMTTYRPLGSWADPASQAYSRWDGELQGTLARANSVRSQARPQLAGLRPKNVELLEDAFLRKHTNKLRNDPRLARRIISNLYRKPIAGRNVLNGYMAEATFLESHPEWGYVGKPNAAQNDVYRLVWKNGRAVPETGQIKYHGSGNPSQYARDMVKDHRAHRFLIPDDHVEATRVYLKSAGRWRDANRVQPIGATSVQIRSDVTKTAQYVARERYATYSSLGAALALSLGGTIYDWAGGDLSANTATYRTLRSLSRMGVGLGGDVALSKFGGGALRGTGRGNAIIGTAIAITETAWLLHEHGWGRAFYQPEFYDQVGGGIGSLALGMVGFAYGTGLAVETGPWAPIIGTGVGVLTGTVGYLGGRTIARSMIEILSPEMLRRQERQRFESVKAALDRNIVSLQNFSILR
jgi:hypothetical protein